MNSNFERLMHELQADRERDIEKRMRVNAVKSRSPMVSYRNRALAWTGGILIRWGRTLQSIGRESQADTTLFPVAK